MDWNEDGNKDLLTGDSSGYVTLYLNHGDNADPVFSTGSRISTGETTFSVSLRATPEVVDWNNDGKKDLLCGEDSGYIYLLLNSGSNASPSFDAVQYLTYRYNTTTARIKVSRTSCPVVVDWDHDGKKDLLTGESAGKVIFYQNIGTDEVPVLTTKGALKAGGVTVDGGDYSRIDVCDWNNDGQWDLLVGTWAGEVLLYQGVSPQNRAQDSWTLY